MRGYGGPPRPPIGRERRDRERGRHRRNQLPPHHNHHHPDHDHHYPTTTATTLKDSNRPDEDARSRVKLATETDRDGALKKSRARARETNTERGRDTTRENLWPVSASPSVSSHFRPPFSFQFSCPLSSSPSLSAVRPSENASSRTNRYFATTLQLSAEFLRRKVDPRNSSSFPFGNGFRRNLRSDHLPRSGREGRKEGRKRETERNGRKERRKGGCP